MKPSSAVALAALLAIAAAPTARANVTIGITDGGGLCMPLSCQAKFGITTYQQVYAAGAFPGPIVFNGVGFHASRSRFSSGEVIDTATYSVSFFLTAAGPSPRNTPGPGTLSTVLGDNLGDPLGSLGTFSLGGLLPDRLDLIGAPITYDPLDGNLLMQITLVSIDGPLVDFLLVGGAGYFQSDIRGVDTSGVYSSGGDAYYIDEVAVLTTFLTVPTPEPASAALLPLAVASLAALRRRRR